MKQNKASLCTRFHLSQSCWYSTIINLIQRPNLRNLSHRLNLSRRSNMMDSTSNFSRLKPALNWNRFFGGFKPRLKFIKFGLWRPFRQAHGISVHPIPTLSRIRVNCLRMAQFIQLWLQFMNPWSVIVLF